jgi:hypothetical protein
LEGKEVYKYGFATHYINHSNFESLREDLRNSIEKGADFNEVE